MSWYPRFFLPSLGSQYDHLRECSTPRPDWRQVHADKYLPEGVSTQGQSTEMLTGQLQVAAMFMIGFAVCPNQ